MFTSSRIFLSSYRAFELSFKSHGKQCGKGVYVCIGATDIHSSVTIFLLEARRRAREKQSLNVNSVCSLVFF